MMSLRVSAILPAMPVCSRGMRARKSPFLTNVSTSRSCLGFKVSLAGGAEPVVCISIDLSPMIRTLCRPSHGGAVRFDGARPHAGEGGPLRRRRAHLDRAAVGAHDLADDVEAEAQPLRSARRLGPAAER